MSCLSVQGSVSHLQGSVCLRLVFQAWAFGREQGSVMCCCCWVWGVPGQGQAQLV